MATTKRIFKWLEPLSVRSSLALPFVAATQGVPAYLSVSKAVEELPADLRPPPHPFSRIAECVHPNGLNHVVARGLLERQGLTRVRAILWNVRFLAWTMAVSQRSGDEVLGLYRRRFSRAAARRPPPGVLWFERWARDLGPDAMLEDAVFHRSRRNPQMQDARYFVRNVQWTPHNKRMQTDEPLACP